MITQETAAEIWYAYRDIDAGEKLLSDMKKIVGESDKYSTSIKDAFGYQRGLQLGIPTGENAHKLLNVSPIIAESVIKAHIENCRSKLNILMEKARIELEQS